MIEIELDEPGLTAMLAAFARGIIASRGPNQVIGRSGNDYLHRWYLVRKATVPALVMDAKVAIPSELENLYLHRYLRSADEERHCHPWGNASLVLSGWYVEDTPEGLRTRRPGDIVIRQAEQVHAIVDVEPGTLSLFATGPKVREWGFHTAEGFVPWAEFRGWKNRRMEVAA